MTRKIRKYLETNKNHSTAQQNLWDAVKAALREKFMAVNAYIEKEDVNRTT